MNQEEIKKNQHKKIDEMIESSRVDLHKMLDKAYESGAVGESMKNDDYIEEDPALRYFHIFHSMYWHINEGRPEKERVLFLDSEIGKASKWLVKEEGED